MSREIFFTLSEYKQNYERLKNKFIDAYIDNDEEEFIERQIQLYILCLKNTVTEVQLRGDTIVNDTVPSVTGVEFVHEVDQKIRNERGVILPEVCQNLNVSFSKIVKFLQEKENLPKDKGGAELSAAQAMLYHYILQEANLEPEFPVGGKIKALESLSLRYGPSANNLKKKYNVIRRGAKRGYDEEDALIVRELIIKNHPTVLPLFQDMTKHILI